jgi:hypothetical protein
VSFSALPDCELRAHSYFHRFERVDPPRKGPARPGEEVKAQYAISNVLGRKVITCRLVTVTRGGAQNKKVMCRVGGGKRFSVTFCFSHSLFSFRLARTPNVHPQPSSWPLVERISRSIDCICTVITAPRGH